MSLLIDTPGSWYADWAWGLPLIVLTVVIHIFCLLHINQKVERVQNAVAGRYSSDIAFVMIVGAWRCWPLACTG